MEENGLEFILLGFTVAFSRPHLDFVLGAWTRCLLAAKYGLSCHVLNKTIGLNSHPDMGWSTRHRLPQVYELRQHR